MQMNSPFTPLKILKHRETMDAIIRDEIPTPLTVEIDPTNLCNNDCIWCMYEEFNKKCAESLSEEFLLSLIKDLSEMGVKSIVLSGGGEPLVNKATPTVIQKAHEEGLEVALVTNGELVNGESLRIIVENCAWIRVSLDAATAETYHRCHGITNRNAFQAVIKNIKSMVSYRKKINSPIMIGLAFLVHPYNFHEIYEACKLARELGIDYIQFRPVYLYGFNLDEKMAQSWATQIQRAKEDFQSEDFIIHSSPERFKLKERKYERCVACRMIGIVAADKHMYVCCQLKGDEKYKSGDLTRKSFKEIWQDPKTHALCDKIDVNQCPPCRYDGYNEILNYLLLSNPTHVSFI